MSAVHAAAPCVEPPAETGFPPVMLQQVAQGFREPVHIAVAPGDSGRLYVVEQAGVVRIVEPGQIRKRSPLPLSRPEPFLDIRGQVESGGEKGLLSIAFHPRYRDNGLFYVDYTARDATGLHTRISRWRRATPDRADPKSETMLLRIGQPYSNHNGGQLAFGPDGYLYIGMGDGGAANDPHGHGQNPGSLLGKLLRIDVDRAEGAQPYAVPPDNPFVKKKEYRPEIWALGLRNPWRFSFDARSGALWLADVGQDRVEEIDIIRKGGNYGWNVMEGRHLYSRSERSLRAIRIRAADLYVSPSGRLFRDRRLRVSRHGHSRLVRGVSVQRLRQQAFVGVARPRRPGCNTGRAAAYAARREQLWPGRESGVVSGRSPGRENIPNQVKAMNSVALSGIRRLA